MFKAVNRLADFLAPRDQYQGGNWEPDTVRIPASAIGICAAVGFALLMAWFVFYGGR
jgi:hypothetical protein